MSALASPVRLAAAACLLLGLAACSTPPRAPEPLAENPAQPTVPEPIALEVAPPESVAPAEPEPDPLASAEERSALTCSSEGVLVAGQIPGELLYRCEGLEQAVSLDALRQAGWMLEHMAIGARAEVDGESGLPLSITVRKLR